MGFGKTDGELSGSQKKRWRILKRKMIVAIEHALGTKKARQSWKEYGSFVRNDNKFII